MGEFWPWKLTWPGFEPEIIELLRSKEKVEVELSRLNSAGQRELIIREFRGSLEYEAAVG